MSDGTPSTPIHRKTVRHFNIPNHAHELTFSCKDRRPLLIDEPVKAIVGQAISKACSTHGFEIVAFVFMPEHLHLIVYNPEEQYDIASLLQAIKKPSSFQIRKWMEQSGDPRAIELKTIRHDRNVFQYWQPGPGFDRNVTNRETLTTMIRYIHNNPVKRGLCTAPEDWIWSSAGQYRAGVERLELPPGVPRVSQLL